MRESTACFIINPEKDGEVLLGFKKTGFGAGKYAGIGGKVETGETVEAAAIREVEEEIGVKIGDADLVFMGRLTFIFPSRVDWSQEVSVFIAERWLGDPKESPEMRPVWFKPGEIPYELMWSDARYWLPKILRGTKIYLTFSFEENNETIAEISIG